MGLKRFRSHSKVMTKRISYGCQFALSTQLILRHVPVFLPIDAAPQFFYTNKYLYYYEPSRNFTSVTKAQH